MAIIGSQTPANELQSEPNEYSLKCHLLLFRPSKYCTNAIYD
jgi:hypothetical protein